MFDQKPWCHQKYWSQGNFLDDFSKSPVRIRLWIKSISSQKQSSSARSFYIKKNPLHVDMRLLSLLKKVWYHNVNWTRLCANTFWCLINARPSFIDFWNPPGPYLDSLLGPLPCPSIFANVNLSNCKVFKQIVLIKGIFTNFCVPEAYSRWTWRY